MNAQEWGLLIRMNEIQSQIGNLSFLFLLGSLIFYWIGLSKPELWKTNQLTKRNENKNVSLDTSGRAKPSPRFGESVVIQPEVSGQLSLTENKNSVSSISLPLNNIVSKASPINIERTLGRYGIIFSNILLFILLCLRWKESGHFPLSNLYESLMFLSWSFTTLHLWLEKSDFVLQLPSLNNNNKNTLNTHVNYTPLIGAITTPSALFTNAFATFTLPKEMQEAAPLVPALQSNWLMMHVTVMIISYAALILGSLLSVAYLIITSLPSYSLSVSTTIFGKNTNGFQNPNVHKGSLVVSEWPSAIRMAEGQPEEPKTNSISFNNEWVEDPSMNEVHSNKIDLYSLAKTLDNLSYRILGIGFPFLTIGILSGAVWANEAWGSYWSWDPKETWALLTWLIFAIYLHSRLNKTDSNIFIQSNSEKNQKQNGAEPLLENERGEASFSSFSLNQSKIQLIINEDRKPAIIATLGLIVVWICYLGVNLIGEGLHSYGWFK